MLFFLSILLIVIGVSGALLLNVIAWQIAATVACMIGVALLIIYYEQKYSALREKNDELRQKLDRQQKGFDRQLSQKDEEISRQRHKLEKSTSIPSIHSDLPILQRVAILRSYFVEENSDIDYRRLFDEIEIAIKNQKLLVLQKKWIEAK